KSPARTRPRPPHRSASKRSPHKRQSLPRPPRRGTAMNSNHLSLRSSFRSRCFAYRPRGFHPAGGVVVNSRLLSFDPASTVNFNPEVSFVRYQSGVIGLPAGGGPPVDVWLTVGASFEITVT